MLKSYIAYLIAFSVVTFFLYAADKRRAILQKWRISEDLLIGFSLFGGAIGGYLAMWLVRHKIRKRKFHLVNSFGIAWQIGLLIYLIVAL